MIMPKVRHASSSLMKIRSHIARNVAAVEIALVRQSNDALCLVGSLFPPAVEDARYKGYLGRTEEMPQPRKPP
jgi:hypothetical protein